MNEIKKKDQQNKLEIEKELKAKREELYQRNLEQSKTKDDQQSDTTSEGSGIHYDDEDTNDHKESMDEEDVKIEEIARDDVYLSDDDEEKDNLQNESIDRLIQEHDQQSREQSKKSLSDICKSKKEERSTPDALKYAKQMSKEKEWSKSKMKKNAASMLDSFVSQEDNGKPKPKFMKDLEMLKKQLASGRVDPKLVNNLKKMDLGF